MKNTIGSIAWHLEIRQSTIWHFCKDFKINLGNFNFENHGYGKPQLKPELVEYLVKNAAFLRKYGKDYYSDKDPEIIASTINRYVEDVEPYLKRNYPSFFKDGELDRTVRYLFRYVSSYKIDYQLSNDYCFLKM